MAKNFFGEQSDNHEEVDCLLKKHGVNISTLNEIGILPLMFAIEKNDMKLFKGLLKAGEKINARGKNGETTYFYAVRNKATKFYEPLINAGANADVRNDDGETPLTYAAKDNNEILPKYGNMAMSNNDGDTPLIIFCRNNVVSTELSVDNIVAICQSGKCNINACNNNGETALYWACINSSSQYNPPKFGFNNDDDSDDDSVNVIISNDRNIGGGNIPCKCGKFIHNGAINYYDSDSDVNDKSKHPSNIVNRKKDSDDSDSDSDDDVQDRVITITSASVRQKHPSNIVNRKKDSDDSDSDDDEQYRVIASTIASVRQKHPSSSIDHKKDSDDDVQDRVITSASVRQKHPSSSIDYLHHVEQYDDDISDDEKNEVPEEESDFNYNNLVGILISLGARIDRDLLSKKEIPIKVRMYLAGPSKYKPDEIKNNYRKIIKDFKHRVYVEDDEFFSTISYLHDEIYDFTTRLEALCVSGDINVEDLLSDVKLKNDIETIDKDFFVNLV
jgi:hypothetical protein